MLAYHQFRAAFTLFLFLPVFGNAHICSERFQQEAAKKITTKSCQKQTLGAEFAWNYSNNTRRLEIVFGAKLDGDTGWLAWGLNPGKEAKMVGTRALIGVKQKNGALVYDTYNITGSTKLGCKLLPSNIDLGVQNFTFVYGKEIDLHMIHATIVLPQEYNDSRINLVWQIGNAAAGKQPFMHPKHIQNFDCKEPLDLISGRVRGGGAHQRQNLRRVHGILNIVGWGTLLPVGAIIARYFKKFPMECPRWFRLHISCQILGYILGTIGWIIGILLGNASKHYGYHTHRILGIIIFTFTTLQMLALRLKPTRSDEYRVYWNMYHHFLGYSLLTIISVNIFLGIAIISTDHTWKWAYVGVLVLLGTTAVVLETFTWIKFFLIRYKESASDRRGPSQSINNGQGSISDAPKGSQASHKEYPGASIGSAFQPITM